MSKSSASPYIRENVVRLENPHLDMDDDYLYHLALGTAGNDLHAMFGDVKFVCLGGTPSRMKHFAEYVMEQIGHELPVGTRLNNLSAQSDRYAMFKVGPVLSVSHGMGCASLGILLHELIKLMHYARCVDPVFVRIGTCGGVGIAGGTVVISERVLDGLLRSTYELPVLGQLQRRPAVLDRRLADELKALADADRSVGYETVLGATIATDCFYEGQGRVDGAFCAYTQADKMRFLRSVHGDLGVRNFEMESVALAALTHAAGIRSAVVCVALLDRLQGDQVTTPKSVMDEWQERPQRLVALLIRQHLGIRA